MEQYKKFIHAIWLDFSHHWYYFLLVITGTNILLEAIVIPLFRFSLSTVLELGNITYLSYTNALPLFIQHPFVALGLVVVVAILLFITFIQFVFVLRGIIQIKQHCFNLKTLVKEVYQVVTHTNWKTFSLFFCYLGFLLPFFNVFFLNSPLLSKLVFPKFIYDEIVNNPFYMTGFALIIAGLFYIGIRSVFTLPELIIRPKGFRAALALSWGRTNKRFFHYAIRYTWIAVTIFTISNAIYFGVYFLQMGFDLLPSPIPVTAVIINLTIVKIVHLLVNVFAVVAYSSVFLNELIVADEEEHVEPTRFTYRYKHWFLIAGVLLLTIYNGISSADTIDKGTETISHRGVTSGNGVQNTIPAMKKTIKYYQPDYIEMDVQETKDHKYVVVHDKNLKKLAGVDKKPQELTLKQLKKMTVRENGYEAKIASFDDYLKVANRHHQKLLVELKTSSSDSKEMVPRFIKQYEKNFEKNGHILQTLSHKAADELKQEDPEAFVSYILPFNFSFPTTDFDAYTMEQTTLNSSFIGKALMMNKKVYVWTVNDKKDMRQSLYLNVDGIITDEMGTLNQEIAAFEKEPTFAEFLLTYTTIYLENE
ncbi:glycerophosphoryl diester phosphodiesterase membrane domain-containing protein [Candidatus Kurthia intestinigallinarum]|uniref:glycerophosphoryl diester phosphodiesterase membrane domain-containing protein n=1 Tax=Candidatus Kurthia intestinigallinarum TaxID=1562256 RepID=UPI000F8D7894|nr:glycerophosphodiester phosphodiesterase [Kurthia sp. 3B1D]